jgi:hypothetical protein
MLIRLSSKGVSVSPLCTGQETKGCAWFGILGFALGLADEKNHPIIPRAHRPDVARFDEPRDPVFNSSFWPSSSVFGD